MIFKYYSIFRTVETFSIMWINYSLKLPCMKFSTFALRNLGMKLLTNPLFFSFSVILLLKFFQSVLEWWLFFPRAVSPSTEQVFYISLSQLWFTLFTSLSYHYLKKLDPYPCHLRPKINRFPSFNLTWWVLSIKSTQK